MVERLRKNCTTSPSSEVKYKCSICKDTGLVETSLNTFKRCQCYEKEKINNLWKKYGVNPSEIKKLNDYIPVDQLQQQAKEKAVKYITEFEDFAGSRENSFGLFGQAGAGKTHIINSIGAALIERGIGTVYMPYVEAMRELKANVMDDENYNKLLSRYQLCKVLIIDDLFKDKFKNGALMDRATITEADMKHIYPIINYRYINYLPTLISTEATPMILTTLDEALAGRIIEPCGSNMVIFQGQQYNYRMKKFIKK